MSAVAAVHAFLWFCAVGYSIRFVSLVIILALEKEYPRKKQQTRGDDAFGAISGAVIAAGLLYCLLTGAA